MEVRQRRLETEKVPVYACATYHRKGTTVCNNRVEVRMADVDLAVLETLEEDVMHPEVVSRALRLAVDAIRPSADQLVARRHTLTAERAKLQQELDRLADAIAAGSSSPTLMKDSVVASAKCRTSSVSFRRAPRPNRPRWVGAKRGRAGSTCTRPP